MTNPIQLVRDYMNESLFEREEAIDAVLSAVIAGQHPFLLGPPGTGKTMLVSKLAECFEDASYFRTLISPTSTPSDVFGPFSLPALERGERVRETRGFLPEADFVYLDEIFKGNGATLNSLLTVINERLFSNGPETSPVPLRSVFASSNETPASDNLKALYDRFTVRLEIPYIADDDLFARLVSGDLPSPVAPKLKLSAIDDAAATAKAVKISEAFMSNLINLRAVMQGSTEFAGLEVSDRRWKSTVGIVKARVALDGGTEVGGDDIRHTACCLWDAPEQIEVVVETLREMCSQGLKDAHLFMTEGREIAKGVQYSTERHELNKALDSFSVLLQSMASDHPEIVRARKSVAKMAQAVQTKLNNMNRIFDLPDSPF